MIFFAEESSYFTELFSCFYYARRTFDFIDITMISFACKHIDFCNNSFSWRMEKDIAHDHIIVRCNLFNEIFKVLIVFYRGFVAPLYASLYNNYKEYSVTRDIKTLCTTLGCSVFHYLFKLFNLKKRV